MTLSELLAELKQVDPETWDVIVRGIPLKSFCQYFAIVHGEQIMVRSPAAYLPFSQMERDVALLWLQGCVQRACERREWDLRQDHWIVKQDGPNDVHHYATIEKGIAETGQPFEYEGRGKSQAEAVLAAYVEAVNLEEACKVERDVREYFSSGGKEMNIFEYLKFCSEVVPGLAEMSHSETDTEKKKLMLRNVLLAYKFVYGDLMPPPA